MRKPKPLLLLVLLGLAGSLLLGSAGFDEHVSPLHDATAQPGSSASPLRGLAALARVLLGAAS